MALTATAQTDVTTRYLTNYGFDSDFHYRAGATNEIKQEIKTITGWTAGFTVDYTITGIYQFGFVAPANVKNLWFVVSGAPTSYWHRDLINWDEDWSD